MSSYLTLKVTIGEVKKHIPISVETYHIWFLTKIGTMKAWVDPTKDNAPVPTIDGLIKVKILKFPNGVRPKIIRPHHSSS